jgi:hypothetical protein
MDIVCLRNISINTLHKGDDDDDDDDDDGGGGGGDADNNACETVRTQHTKIDYV